MLVAVTLSLSHISNNNNVEDNDVISDDDDDDTSCRLNNNICRWYKQTTLSLIKLSHSLFDKMC